MKRTLALVILLIAATYLSHTQTPDGKSVADFTTSPKVKWTFKTKAPLVGSPQVSDGLAFFGGNDSVLYALDAETGGVKWKFTTQGPIRSTVAIDGNDLFLVGGDGKVYGFDKHSGKVEWTFSTEGEKIYPLYGYADYYFSSPVVKDGVLYFGSGDGYVYALRTADGSLAWRFKTGDVVHSSPVLYGGKLFIGSFDGYVYALQRETGALAWKFKSVGHRFFPAGEMQGTPVAANGLVYIGSRDYNLYALDTAKGYCHWNKQFPKGWAMALSVRDTLLYVGTSDDDLLLAVDGRTGKEFWKTDVHFNIFGSPSFSQSMIYTGTLLGKVLGLDLKTGAIRWEFNTEGYNQNHARYFKSETDITKDEFYSHIESNEGYIDALHALGAVFSTPVISDGLMFVTSTDETLYCLER